MFRSNYGYDQPANSYAALGIMAAGTGDTAAEPPSNLCPPTSAVAIARKGAADAAPAIVNAPGGLL